MINENIKEIMLSKDNLIKEIYKNGFDILKDYKVIKCDFNNELIKIICFELKNNPLNTDYDYNGCIKLLFDIKEDKIKCQIQCDAMTDDIDYSNFTTYNDYYDIENDLPNFENQTDSVDWSLYCDFNKIYNTKYFKTNSIFKNISKYIIESDKNIKQCIKTQDKINEFEHDYYERVLDLDSENKYGKFYGELTEEEQNELIDERDGIATYNMMVREGWIDED